MAEQSGRKPFRFRFPWLINTAPRAPAKPVISAQPPPRSSVRPPSPRPSSQPQAPQRTELQNLSPPHTISLKSSPAKTAQSQVPVKIKSQSPSPVQMSPQSRVTSPPSSPSKTATPTKPKSSTYSPAQKVPQFQMTPPSSLTSRTTFSQPQPSEKTNSRASSQYRTNPETPILSPAPSQEATHASSQTSLPLLITSQLDTKTSSQLDKDTASQPPFPSHMTSQLEPEIQKVTPLSSPLFHALQSLSTTQAAIEPESPRSSVLQTELPPKKIAPTQQELSATPPLQYSQEAEKSSGRTYQLGSSQQSTHEYQVDKIKGTKTESKEEKSTVLIEEERKQRGVPELLRSASGSNKFRYQLDIFENEEKQQNRQSSIHDIELLAKVASGKETTPIIQHYKHAESEEPPSSPQEDPSGSSKSKYQPDTAEERKQQQQKQATTKNYSHASTEDHQSYAQDNRSVLYKKMNDDISRFTQYMSVNHPEKTINENPESIITILGENRGATMHLGFDATKKESSINTQKGHKFNQEDISDTTSNGENNRSFEGPAREDAAHINSNIQSANNSILLDSAIHGRNPGVHVVFHCDQTEPTKSNRKTESIEAKKANFNIIESQKLTCEPTAEQRCLRGIFLEPRDSNPDNTS